MPLRYLCRVVAAHSCFARHDYVAMKMSAAHDMMLLRYDEYESVATTEKRLLPRRSAHRYNIDETLN